MAFVLVMANAWAQNTDPTIPTRTGSDNLTWTFDMPGGNHVLRTIWKQDAGLAYAKSDTTIYLGDPFSGQELTNSHGIPVTYSIVHKAGTNSGNTINSEGIVTIHGVGIDTVKAIFAGNDTLLADTAYYIIDARTTSYYILTLATAGDGTVTIATPLPAGVTNNNNGTYTVISGTEVIITATANTGYRFENWTNENNDEIGTDAQITLMVTGDTTARANFELKTYTVTVIGTPDRNYGSAEITSGSIQHVSYYESANKYVYTVNHGTTITIEATPTTGRHFAAWEGDIDSDVNPLEIVGVDHDYTISAYFEVNTYSVTASGDHGSVELSGAGLTTDGQHGKYGGEVIFTAIPDAGYRFVSWNDNNTDNPRHITISGEVHLTATFERDQHTLTLSAIGNGTVEIQTIDGNKAIIPSSSISVRECCTSESGQGCDKLFDGIITGGNKWCSVAEPKKFVEFRTTNAVRVSGYTLFTGDDNETWGAGRNPKSWVLKANLDGSDNWTTIDSVANDATMQDINYTAYDFEMDVPGTYRNFRFEVSEVVNGTILQLGELQLFYIGNTFPDGVTQGDTPDTYIVDYGTEVTVKAIPDAGYALLNWSDDHSADATRTVIVTSDTNLVATFGLLTPGLTPLGELTTFGHSFVSETGEIKGVPRITETGEFTEVSSREPTTIDLSTITEAFTAQNGDTLTGTLDAKVKISIAKGATVMLDGATINGTHSMSYLWAGITCKGDATIILKDGTTNKVTGFNNEYPGIYVPMGSTLTIKGGTQGTDSLIVGSNGFAAGIGAGLNHKSCGNIIIQGGNIVATGDLYAAGIGGAYVSNCGDIKITGGNITAKGGVGAAGIGGGRGANCGTINISGGTVIAEGGDDAAGIGGGGPIDINTQCGSITITSTVNSVTAKKSADNPGPNSIGAGKYGSCGTVSIGNSTGAISTSPYTYQP